MVTSKKQRVARTRAGQRWTESRFFSFIRSALRASAMRYPVKFDALNAVKRSKPAGRPGKHRFEYQCASCSEHFPQSEVAVDHIIPAGSLKSFEDLGPFAEKLFCEVDGLQILCNPCHQIKTNAERKSAKANK